MGCSEHPFHWFSSLYIIYIFISFSKTVLQKEELEQKHLHLVQIVESEKTAKWQYTQQCEELTMEIKKLRAEVCHTNSYSYCLKVHKNCYPVSFLLIFNHFMAQMFFTQMFRFFYCFKCFSNQLFFFFQLNQSLFWKTNGFKCYNYN